jgi:N-acetyl sugar amidotransferase
MNYQICSKCVLEVSPLSNLTFDDQGVCNHCRAYENFVTTTDALNWDKKRKELDAILHKIKKTGARNQYDCILGLSGGFDSTYLALLTKQFGLRPLVVHFDNGWNSELAVNNIHNIVTKFGYDLHTYVINWEEFRDLQLAYFKASVIDIEVPTDHFVFATLYEIAAQKKIKYILDGINFLTEYGPIFLKWSYSKSDLVNLESIHNRFGTIPLKKYPKLGIYQRFYYFEILNIRNIRLNDYLPFNKKETSRILEKELNWRDPGGKHYESIFTRFYQGYILPVKFHVDKRRLHYSNLIWSGQMTREEALRLLEGPTYDPKMQESDKTYVLKKYNLSEEEFQELMDLPIVSHDFYGTEEGRYFFFRAFRWTFGFIRRVLLKLGRIIS